jgi:hypothetical protein
MSRRLRAALRLSAPHVVEILAGLQKEARLTEKVRLVDGLHLTRIVGVVTRTKI